MTRWPVPRNDSTGPLAGVKKPATWPRSFTAASVTEEAPAMFVKVAWLDRMLYTKPWALPAESFSKPTATSESLTPSSWVTAGLPGASPEGNGTFTWVKLRPLSSEYQP